MPVPLGMGACPAVCARTYCPAITRIRRARAEDAPAIARMAAALSAAEGSPAPAFDAAACQYHGFGKDPCFEVLLAEVDDRPAGYALYHPSYDTDRVVRAVWLADLYVESWARGTGLGRRLAAQVAANGRHRRQRSHALGRPAHQP